MKLVKLLGLAMVAAIATMALLGTGTASAASEVCYTKTNPCSEPVSNNTPIRATLQSEQAVLKGIGVEVHCQKSEAKGKITVNPGTTMTKGQVVGEMTSLTFEECGLNSEPEKNCKVITEGEPPKFKQLPYTVHVNQGAALGEGTMYVGPLTTYNAKGEPEAKGLQPGAELSTGCKLNVFPFTNLEGCIYKVKETQPEYPGEWGKLKIEDQTEGGVQKDHANAEQVKLKTNFECGTEGFWNAKYTLEAEKSAGVWVAIFIV